MYKSLDFNLTNAQIKVLKEIRIDLASSERNFLISQFNLLSAIGRLTAKQLNLEK